MGHLKPVLDKCASLALVAAKSPLAKREGGKRNANALSAGDDKVKCQQYKRTWCKAVQAGRSSTAPKNVFKITPCFSMGTIKNTNMGFSPE